MRASRGMGALKPSKRPGAEARSEVDKLSQAKRNMSRVGYRKKSRENLGSLTQRDKK